ncbi:ATP-dependent DNA-helicase, RecQ family protein [Sesbania bispinosa]|nr:ATP-dependent DNA-helicase, RecQ family protein [Sesbania bispinosa]
MAKANKSNGKDIMSNMATSRMKRFCQFRNEIRRNFLFSPFWVLEPLFLCPDV